VIRHCRIEHVAKASYVLEPAAHDALREVERRVQLILISDVVLRTNCDHTQEAPGSNDRQSRREAPQRDLDSRSFRKFLF
jgi:hypothetical protein